MTDETVVEAEVVDEPGQELVQAPAPAGNLMGTDDPVEVVEKASRVATALKGVLEKQGLTSNIQGRSYVRVEGLQTLATMLGVTSVCVWTRKVDDGWEARSEVRTMDGRVIGAAEAECLRSERTWKKRDDYAVRSMAQTRASAKALRSVLAFVVSLAGYETTPAEEMPGQPDEGAAKGPTHGPEASPDDQGKARVALASLLGTTPDDEAVTALMQSVAARCGYLPRVVTSSWQLTARKALQVLERENVSDVPAVPPEVIEEDGDPTELPLDGEQ